MKPALRPKRGLLIRTVALIAMRVTAFVAAVLAATAILGLAASPARAADGLLDPGVAPGVTWVLPLGAAAGARLPPL